MPDEMTTKPTIETVLERISAFEKRFESRTDQLEGRFERLEMQMSERFEQVYNEIDRVASVVHSTKAEMLTLRADFREMRAQLKDVLPVPQAP